MFLYLNFIFNSTIRQECNRQSLILDEEYNRLVSRLDGSGDSNTYLLYQLCKNYKNLVADYRLINSCAETAHSVRIRPGCTFYSDSEGIVSMANNSVHFCNTNGTVYSVSLNKNKVETEGNMVVHKIDIAIKRNLSEFYENNIICFLLKDFFKNLDGGNYITEPKIYSKILREPLYEKVGDEKILTDWSIIGPSTRVKSLIDKFEKSSSVENLTGSIKDLTSDLPDDTKAVKASDNEITVENELTVATEENVSKTGDEEQLHINDDQSSTNPSQTTEMTNDDLKKPTEENIYNEIEEKKVTFEEEKLPDSNDEKWKNTYIPFQNYPVNTKNEEEESIDNQCEKPKIMSKKKKKCWCCFK